MSAAHPDSNAVRLHGRRPNRRAKAKNDASRMKQETV